MGLVVAMTTGPVMAQEAVTLPTVSVTGHQAGQTGVPQEDETTAITVITGEEIENKQIRRLEDALRLVPGVTLSGTRGIGSPGTVTLRGLGPRNVRVFIDGVEVSDTSQSQSQYAISELNMSDVARIEVLRGPQPGRFGADAGGGVINIQTKRPDRPFAAAGMIEGGSYGTVRSNASVSGTDGTFDYRLSVSGTRSDGYSDFNEDRGGEAEDPFRQYSFAGNFGVQATEALRFDAVARYQREDVFYDGSSSDMDWDRDESETFLRAAATYVALDDRLTQTLGAGHNKTTRQYWGSGTDGDTYDGYKTVIDYRGRFRASDMLALDFGADATREKIDQHTPGFAPATPDMVDDFWKYGAYVTAGITPVQSLDLTATARFDDHEDFGDEATWRLGASYLFDATGTRVHASYGTAWQTPSLYERYDPCYGNAALKPEKSKGWDAGIEQSGWDGRFSVGATYFEASTEDQINWAYSPPTSTLCYGGGYVNVDKTKSRGLEVELALRLIEAVELRAAYTRQEVSDENTGLRIPQWPRNQANITLGWQVLEATYVDIGVDYRDSIDRYGKGDAYWLTNLRVEQGLTEQVKLFGRIENLFDREYEASFGYGTPGISAYAGLGVSF